MECQAQSNTPSDAPPEPGLSPGEGALFVDFMIEEAEIPELMICSQHIADRSGRYCVLLYQPDVDYSSRLRAMVVLCLSRSTTEMIAIELTLQIQKSLRRFLRRSQTWLPAVSWVPDLESDQEHDLTLCS